MSKSKIVIVDDEATPGLSTPQGNYMWYYRAALCEAGFEVIEIKSAEDAIARVDSGHFADVALVVVDIMMPAGSRLSEVEVDGGFRTGVYVIKRMRQVGCNVPVVVLTNVDSSDMRAGWVKSLAVDRVCKKQDYLPFAFVEVVREVIGDRGD